MSEREGVEIDYCPKCRGVWLDRGELDKIIERMEGNRTGGNDNNDEGGFLDNIFGGFGGKND